LTDPVRRSFRLITLGGLYITAGSTVVDRITSQRKLLALLALLAVAKNKGLSRDKILALLWPESETVQARNALSQLVFRARRDLGADAIVGTVDLRLNSELISSDVEDILALLASGDDESAVGLYDGPFLDGFFVSDAPEFERWVQEQRTRLHGVVQGALDRLANRSAMARDLSGVVRWRQRSAQLEPLSSRAATAYIVALANAGDRTVALRFGAEYEALLRVELDAEPDAAFLATLENLKGNPVQLDSTPALAPSSRASNSTAHSSQQPTSESRETIGERLTGPRWLKTVTIASLVGAILVFVNVRLARDSTSSGADATSSPPVVIVAPIENISGDATLDALGRVASAMISVDLLRSGLVGVVDVNSVVTPSGPSGSANVGNLDPLPSLVRSTGSRLIVSGTIQKRDDSVNFVTRITEPGGRVLSALEPVPLLALNPSSGIAEVSSRLTGALASLIDDRIATLRHPGMPPPRFEAYEEYVKGLDFFSGRYTPRFDYPSAILHFTRAAELDTSFNLPLIWLIHAYRNLQKSDQRDSVYELLKRKADRLTVFDKTALDFFTANSAGNEERAYQALVTLSNLMPLSNWTHNRAMMAHKSGRAGEAAALYRQLDADRTWIKSWVFYWVYYSSILHDMGRFDEEMTVVRDGLRHSKDPWAFVMAFKAWGAEGDTVSIAHLADSLELYATEGAIRGSAGSRLRFAALEASVHGHPREARSLARRCVQAFRAHDGEPDYVLTNPLSRSRFLSSLADCHSLLEEWTEARAAASEAVRFNDTYGDDAAIRSILIAAHLQDTAGVRQLRDEAYARPQFQPNSLRRHLTAALLAAMRNDAKGTATELGRIQPPFGGFGRNVWHTWPEITATIRASREMRSLVRMQ
jgi:DNA-binding SARP family transcriptional activator/TolB-like protein